MTGVRNVGIYGRYALDAVGHAATSRRRTRFVVYGLGRNGTELLTDLLNSHPSIQCDGEILAQPVAASRLQVAGHAMHATKPVYGFKLLNYHLTDVQHVDPPAFVGWLRRRGYHVVHLRRRDPVRHALSNINARVHGFHHRGHLPDSAAAGIHVDTDELLRWIDGLVKNSAYNDEMLAKFSGVSTFTYEDDLLDGPAQARTVEAICDVLGLPPLALSSDLVRTTSAPLADLIENYDEVAMALAGTPYARFLDDGPGAVP
jgi:hypothetical protein